MQPNCYTILKTMSVEATSIFVLCIQQSSTTKNIQLVTLPKYSTPKSMTSLGTVSLNVKVVPPKGLYHPVLPQRVKVDNYEKLVFTLCKACAETRNQNKCEHSDNERSFIGTWTTDEVNKAIEKGYKVIRTYEVWHFGKSTDDLSKGYIRRFMKIKSLSLVSTTLKLKRKRQTSNSRSRRA